MPVQVTHNNDGHFYTIDVDIAKEGAEVFDLSTYFKARVSDNNFGLRVRWFWQGQILKTVGLKPHVEGVVGQYSFKKSENEVDRELVMSPDASSVAFTGDVNHCEPGGYATYYFPEQMFPQDGLFKGTIGLIDDSGKTARYTSVDIWFKVYPQAGGAQMGKACDYYISELEKTIKEAADDLANSQKSMQKVVDDFTAKMNDLTNRLTTQGNTDQTALDALEAKIKQDNLFTEDEAKDLENRLAVKLSTESANAFEHTYGTVNEMLSDESLGAGMYARTAGYYAASDGGGADYLITSKTPLNYSETLKNGLFAQLLYESEPVNVLTFGVKNDGTQDSSEIINEQTKLHALYFPAGKYLVNNQLDIYHNLKGETSSASSSKDDVGLTTLISGIIYDSNDPTTVPTSMICNHGSATVIQNINLRLNTDENGITDNGFNVTRIKNVFVRNLKEACGVKIDRGGSRASIIEDLFIESSNDGVYNNIGLYYLTGTDELLTNFWSMGCQTGIHATVCLFYGTNIHIWCGSSAKGITEDWWNATSSIFLQSSFAYLTNVYLDTMRFGILTNKHSVASVKNIIVNFDESIDSLKNKADNIELSHSEDSDFITFDGGFVYSDRESDLGLFNNGGKATINNVVVQVDDKPDSDYLSDHYRYLLPNMAWGYGNNYQVEYPSGVNGSYAEIARIPIGKTTSGTVKIYISDNHNGVEEVLAQITDGQIKATNLGAGTRLALAYRIVNNWLLIYAQLLNGYNAFGIEAKGGGTFSLVNYKYLRRTGQQVFNRLQQNDDSGLTKIPTDGTWVAAKPTDSLK